MNHDFANEIAKMCLRKFEKLPKQGKPKPSEWTVLSSIFLYRDEKENFEDNSNKVHLVSLATGTKCLDGGTRRKSSPGTLIHDSHAEVLARRSFILWLLHQINAAKEGSSQFVRKFSDGSFQFDESWKIGMMSTRLPCGDAAIFVKETDDNLDHEPDVKKQKLDLNRTGAKTLTKEQGVSGEGDPLLPGVDYHVTGELRTKPGRGLTTLSLSCSDKMLKWNVLGIQGSLCSYLLQNKVFLSSLIIVNKVFNEHSLDRAIHNRVEKVIPVNHVHSLNVNLDFEYHKSDARIDPSPDSVIWINIKDGEREALTEGHKQGWSRKKLDNPKSWSMLCQRNMTKKFLEVYSSSKMNSYLQIKTLSPQYKEKNIFIDNCSIFKKWPIKSPSEFTVQV